MINRRFQQPRVSAVATRTLRPALPRSWLLWVAVAVCVLAVDAARGASSGAPIGTHKRIVSPYARAAAAHAAIAPTPGHPRGLHSPTEVQGLGMRTHKQAGKPH